MRATVQLNDTDTLLQITSSFERPITYSQDDNFGWRIKEARPIPTRNNLKWYFIWQNKYIIRTIGKYSANPCLQYQDVNWRLKFLSMGYSHKSLIGTLIFPGGPSFPRPFVWPTWIQFAAYLISVPKHAGQHLRQSNHRPVTSPTDRNLLSESDYMPKLR